MTTKACSLSLCACLLVPVKYVDEIYNKLIGAKPLQLELDNEFFNV